MPQDMINKAVSEYIRNGAYSDQKRHAVFLWCLWRRLSENENVIHFLNRMSTEDYEALSEPERPEDGKDLLDRIITLRDNDVLPYLARCTVIIQRRAANLVTPTLNSRPVELKKLTHLETAVGNYYVLRRPRLLGTPMSYEQHRRIPRCLFPDLRVIPGKINDGVEVDVVPLPTSRRRRQTSFEMRPRTFATSATYKVELDDVGKDLSFRLAEISAGAEGRGQELRTGLDEERAREDQDRFVVFWPELSIDAAIFSDFAGYLQGRSKDGSSDPIRMVMPGTFSVESQSRLEEHGGGRRSRHAPNRAILLNADTGEEVSSQDKMRAFVTKIAGRRAVEAIVETSVLTVCRADWGTFCILICRDAVDFNAPFIAWLDVDFIIVPSMGDRKTRGAWHGMAVRLGQGWGGRSALALQSPPSLPDGVHRPDPRSDHAEVYPNHAEERAGTSQ